MTQDLIELLDRQFQFLLRQEGSTFLRELRRTFEVLQREPRLAALLDDERRSALSLIDRFAEHERRFTEELVALRNELIRLAPDLDDSAALRPSDAWPEADFRWLRTLAAFDAISRGKRPRGLSGNERDTSQTLALIGILYRKLESARWVSNASGEPLPAKQDQRPELDPIDRQRQQLQEKHAAVWRPFYDSLLTAPGAHLLYIEDLISQMSRMWSSPTPRTPQLALIIDSLKLPSQYSFTSLLYDALDHENKKTAADAEEKIAKLRPTVERIYEGLRLRIGTTRSLIALFNRFRTRCQFHDRERLRDLAKHPPTSVAGRAQLNRRSKTEQILTEELARYLFDQGLNPLTEVPTAGLRPDVLDPGYLYVEAKQYSSRNPRPYLIKGARQVYETMGRLRGSRYQVHEAFYVVFRLGGRHISLPDRIPFGEWTLYPVLIDLAPASESGSRARDSIVITDEELRPRLATSRA